MALTDSQRWWLELYVKNLVLALAVNVAFVLIGWEEYPGAAWFAVRTIVWGIVFLLVDVAVRHMFGDQIGPNDDSGEPWEG